ncbi:ribonuclease T [Novosphingobium sp. Gsoil 351]|nr:ribonuclease T [Novosphingobium sp. Gsoil 351]
MAPAAASAQAYKCRMPADIGRIARTRADAEAQRVPIAGYTLALTWAPEFCRGKERDPAHRLQCSGATGRFGFVVHGLWPEGVARSPQWCRAVPAPTSAAVRGQLCRTPSVGLIAHEWAKHGSCMARDAAGYFRVSNILSDAMRYPPIERLSRDRGLTAGALREALAKANPGRPASSFGLLTSRSGWLREIRVCLDRRFRPARCKAQQMGPRDASSLKIWRGL